MGLDDMTALIAPLTTASQNSAAISGNDILRVRQATSQAVPAIQVIYTGNASGNFEVKLMGGFEVDGTITYGEVATIDQDGVNNPITMPFSSRMYYRFEHQSGANVTCIIG